MAAGDFGEIYSGDEEKGKWAGVVTCFFIDCVRFPLDFLDFLYLVVRCGLMTGEERITIPSDHPRSTRRRGNLDKPRTPLMAFRKLPTSFSEGRRICRIKSG